MMIIYKLQRDLEKITDRLLEVPGAAAALLDNAAFTAALAEDALHEAARAINATIETENNQVTTP